MAITGSGTQADPYIVHSYEEISQVVSANRTQGKYYIKLANDINCNDYGEDFEWSTIITPGDGITYDFDLDTHAIKNIKVAANNFLFRGNSSTTYGDWLIHDGKILNVFLNGAVGFSAPLASQENNKSICYTNVSISIDGTGATGAIFNGAYFDTCAIYFVSNGNGIVNQVFSYYSGAHVIGIKNSDIYLDISDVHELAIAKNRNGNSNNYTVTMLDCRFTGKVKGLAYLATISGRYYYRAILGDSKIKLQSCCISIDSRELVINPISSNVNMLKYVSGNMSNLGNAVNKSIMHETYPGDQPYDLSSTDIVNGDALRNVGFTVVNVVGG